MTPFDWASLSLNGAELPPPTVGGSPFVSGGHVAPFSRDGFALGCASAKFTAATVANAATTTTPAYKANSSSIAERVHHRAGPQNVPHLRGEAACRVRQRACTLVWPPYSLLPLARKVGRLPPIENEPVARILVERTWPATIRTWSSLVPARLVLPRAGGLPKPDSIALLWRPGHALAGGRGRSTLIRPVRSISAAAGSIRPTATHGGNLLRYKTARSTKRRRHGCVLRLQLDFLCRSRPPSSRPIENFIRGSTLFPTKNPTFRPRVFSSRSVAGMD